MSSQYIGVFSVGTTLDRGLRLYKQSFKRVFPLLLVPMMIGMLPYLSGSSNLYSPTYSPFQILIFIVNIGVGLWAWSVGIRYLQKLAMGENPSVSEMLKLSGPQDLALILTYIIWGFILFVSMFFLVIPALYFSNFLMTALIVATIERQYSFEGLSRTFGLIKGRYWKTFAVNFIAILIVMVPSMIGIGIMTSLMAVSMNGASMADPAAAPSGMLPVIGMAVYMLVIALVFPIYSATALVHYNSLRSEKESLDLEQSIEEIGDASVQNTSSTV
ncbi:MAG: hypothetical protein ACLFQB_14855 [Chitinispirillaceae bacterium]